MELNAIKCRFPLLCACPEPVISSFWLLLLQQCCLSESIESSKDISASQPRNCFSFRPLVPLSLIFSVKIIIKRGTDKKIPPSSTGYDKYVATFFLVQRSTMTKWKLLQDPHQTSLRGGDRTHAARQVDDGGPERKRGLSFLFDSSRAETKTIQFQPLGRPFTEAFHLFRLTRSGATCRPPHRRQEGAPLICTSAPAP